MYRKTHTLLSSDVDASRRLRLSALLTMLQEAAIAHTTQLGMGREKTLDRGLLWIVTLQQIRVFRLPVYDETVTLVSWPGKTMHLYFPRYYRMTDAAGQTLLEGAALWALMDRKDRHIVFPEEHGIRIEEEAEETGPQPALPAPPRMPGLSPAGTFTVPYSYTDLNGHMNNTRYLDLAEDRMPAALREMDVTEIRTEYAAEASAGETIGLQTAEEKDGFAMAGFSEDGRRLFRLMLRFA